MLDIELRAEVVSTRRPAPQGRKRARKDDGAEVDRGRMEIESVGSRGWGRLTYTSDISEGFRN